MGVRVSPSAPLLKESNSMDMNEYQKWSATTAVYRQSDAESKRNYLVYGLTSEVGEVAGVIKRRRPDGTTDSEYLENMKKELGDVLWYLARLSAELGFDLTDVAQANQDKLNKRKMSNTIHGKGDNR